jgi:hypothetical protein
VCAARLGDPDRRTRAAARLYRASVNTAPQQIPLNALTTASGTSRRLSHAYTAVAALAPIQIDQQENEIAVRAILITRNRDKLRTIGGEPQDVEPKA